LIAGSGAAQEALQVEAGRWPFMGQHPEPGGVAVSNWIPRHSWL
jgi:hypothetical protein